MKHITFFAFTFLSFICIYKVTAQINHEKISQSLFETLQAGQYCLASWCREEFTVRTYVTTKYLEENLYDEAFFELGLEFENENIRAKFIELLEMSQNRAIQTAFQKISQNKESHLYPALEAAQKALSLNSTQSSIEPGTTIDAPTFKYLQQIPLMLAQEQMIAISHFISDITQSRIKFQKAFRVLKKQKYFGSFVQRNQGGKSITTDWLYSFVETIYDLQRLDRFYSRNVRNMRRF
jgi:hypothetical protein